MLNLKFLGRINEMKFRVVFLAVSIVSFAVALAIWIRHSPHQRLLWYSAPSVGSSKEHRDCQWLHQKLSSQPLIGIGEVRWTSLGGLNSDEVLIRAVLSRCLTKSKAPKVRVEALAFSGEDSENLVLLQLSWIDLAENNKVDEITIGISRLELQELKGLIVVQ